MNENDDQLHALLRQWPAAEPRPTLTPDILRRVRLAAAAAPADTGWSWLPAWLATPRRLALAACTVLALALASGFVSATTLPPAPHTAAGAPKVTGFSLLDPGTPTGDYVALTGDAHP